jgi:hypothetical protein
MSNMSFLNRVRKLFEQSVQKAGAPRLAAADLLEHVSMQLQNLANELQQRIEAAAAGREGAPRSVVEYVIKDRDGAELQTEWADVDYISREQIMRCPGYQALMTRAQQLNVKLVLSEEGGLEYADEDRNRYTVTLSGWG